MKKLISILSLLLLLSAVNGQQYMSGYSQMLKGNTLEYHSPQPDANKALLVRSEDERNYMEWETESIPAGYNENRVNFLFMAGIDVNPDDPHHWNIYVNDQKYFEIKTPLDTNIKSYTWESASKAILTFEVHNIDKYGDFMGYMVLSLPVNTGMKGKPVRIKAVGQNAGSRTWFMIFMYDAKPSVKLVAEQAIVRTENGSRQVLRADIVHYDKKETADIVVGKEKFKKEIDFGYNSVHVDIPEMLHPTNYPVKIIASDKVLYEGQFLIQPVQKRTIYLLHHSHNDIGYTHVQDEVEQIQWENLETAIEVAQKTQSYPRGSRLKWNVEVMWAVESYLKEASEEEYINFKEAVQNGWIELDALYGNELLALCTEEEMIRLTDYARYYSKNFGVPLKSAMISDIPGWSWGMVPILARSGVEYLSFGNNSGHRIGSMTEEWGDRPFYWVSQSGEEKILTWIHEKGYSLFHTGLKYDKLKYRLDQTRVLGYMNELNEMNYDYDIVALRYNIGSDNGPVDVTLPDAVREWNEKYISPKIIISTVAEAFSAFERKYANKIPAFQGDLSAYWEDGAISTARETALNRNSAASLNQWSTIYSLLDPEFYPSSKIEDAWKSIMLFDEHTWGSWNAISEPHADFTTQQWNIKKSFAEDANRKVDLLKRDLVNMRSTENLSWFIEVINTQSYPRNGIVRTREPGLEGKWLMDINEELIEVQKLSTGEFAFYVKDVPPLGAKGFRKISAGDPPIISLIHDNIMENDFLKLSIDESTGAISEIWDKELNRQLVDTDSLSGLNAYYYVLGRDPISPQGVDEVEINILENGPVVYTLQVKSKAPGAVELIREISIYKNCNQIDIVNRINKADVYEPEGVHFAFPFAVNNGQVRYDMAFSVVRTECDQLPGSNKNYMTMENWLDVSNNAYGVTLACPDAPLFEQGKIMNDPIAYGYINHLERSQTVFSYVMNNYWETNYKASQPGWAAFRYSLKPHSVFNNADAERFGLSIRHPLIALNTGNGRFGALPDPPFRIHSQGIIVYAMRPTEEGDAYIVHLKNISAKPEILDWDVPNGYYKLCDFDGKTIKPISGQILIPAYGIRNIRVELGYK